MCINKVIEFTDFMSFYKKYKPLTPYGVDHKNALPFYTQANDLDNLHEKTDLLIDLLKADEHQALKVEHHLSRIDRLNSLDKSEFDSVDLHLVKKFLIHHRAIVQILAKKHAEAFGLQYNAQVLLSALMPEQDSSESFYLSSAFDEKLQQTRRAIIELDTRLKAIRENTLENIQSKYQLQFSGREFVLVNKQRSELLEAKELNTEFYDAHLIKIKPAFGKEYLDTLQEKEELLIRESEIEKSILIRLSLTIQQHKNELIKAANAICLLDTCLAKARLALQLDMSKPNYKATNMKVKNGIYYPLREKHAAKNLDYTPLNASFDSNTILLSGSNMGGKTVLFKTLAFLQLLTQSGFRIPATEFHTRVYSAIHILGTSPNNGIEGLSSFGQEIHQLTTAFESQESRLIFVDELAKTTNATEAKAILVAALKHTVDKAEMSGFFSTHFVKVPDIEGVSKYQMKGLNKQAFEQHCAQQSEDINEKIRLINAFMQYEVIADKDQAQSNDALTIAGLLGLQSEILNYAKDYLERQKKAK